MELVYFYLLPNYFSRLLIYLDNKALMPNDVRERAEEIILPLMKVFRDRTLRDFAIILLLAK